MDLEKLIQKGIQHKPPRIVLHGPPGIGKSTWASGAPDPVFIQTEDGLSEIDTSKFPLCKCIQSVYDYISMLITKEHGYKTVVIDTIDWLEKLILAEICKENNVKSIEEIGFGKGYVFAMRIWERFLGGVEKLRNDKNMAIILLAHDEIKTFNPPDNDPYDRYQIKIHRRASAMVEEWADAVLFANIKTFVSTEKGAKKGKAVGSERVIYTEGRPAWRAKNRYNLPEEIPMDFNELLTHIKGVKKNG